MACSLDRMFNVCGPDACTLLRRHKKKFDKHRESIKAFEHAKLGIFGLRTWIHSTRQRCWIWRIQNRKYSNPLNHEYLTVVPDKREHSFLARGQFKKDKNWCPPVQAFGWWAQNPKFYAMLARVRSFAERETLNISFFFCKIKYIVASKQSIVFWVVKFEILTHVWIQIVKN